MTASYWHLPSKQGNDMAQVIPGLWFLPDNLKPAVGNDHFECLLKVNKLKICPITCL